jgi:hypothetical protein
MCNNKIQALLITHLTKHGMLRLLLPNSIVLEIGINQIGKNGELVNTDDYCWIMASQDDRMAILDSYNLGVRFNSESKAIVLEDNFINDEGKNIRRLDVV